MPNLWKKIPNCLEESEIERKVQSDNKEKAKTKFAVV
jgi:hypothetical protein